MLMLLSRASPEQIERARFADLERIERACPANPNAWAAWKSRHLEAQWDYGLALNRLAEARRTHALWIRVETFWTGFVWEHDEEFAGIEARGFINRARQALKK